ncbi:MAG: T9SS type A sorting domain-containing protein [Flavobacteriaceae bacterium]|nr:T9SS type A sorting domain-containing protein [Flavobacteriaceae bacterium]
MKKLLLILIFFVNAVVYGISSNIPVSLDKFSININQQEPTLVAIMASPNPFSVKTTISFTSIKEQEVTFTVKNLLGKTVFSNKLEVQKGENQFDFYKNDLNPGMYLYSFQTPKEIISKRLVIK